MARIRNPLLQSSGGPVASSGFSVAPPDPQNGAMGGIAQAIAGLVGAATYDPERDPRVQQGEYYKAQTEGKNREIFANEQVSNVLASLSTMTPEEQSRVTREALTAYARGGGDPKNIASLIQTLVPNMGGTEDMIRRSAAGAGARPVGLNDSYTEPAQAALRADEERRLDEDRATQEGGLNSRNRDTIAGAMERERLQETGRMARRFDGTTNTPQGTTTSFHPEDPKRPMAPAATPDNPSPPRPSTLTVPPKAESVSQVIAEMIRNGDYEGARKASEASKATTPKPAVDLKTVDELDGEINAQIGYSVDKTTGKATGVPMSPKLQAAVRERAAVLMQSGDNPVMAVRKALDELTEEYKKPEIFGGYAGSNPTERIPRRAPLGAPPAPGGNSDPLGIR
jgi:hypothetical protein